MMDADYHQLALLIGTHSLSHLGFRSVGLDCGFDFFCLFSHRTSTTCEQSGGYTNETSYNDGCRGNSV
jgi:hypothetical protein